MKKEINPSELDFLLRFPSQANVTSPVDFIPNLAWGAIKVSHVIKQKIQQVNLRDPPGKVAVTCRELQYHSNLHKNNSLTLHDLQAHYHMKKPCCIFDPSLVETQKTKNQLKLQYHNNSHKKNST